jgi:hypothetical protein
MVDVRLGMRALAPLIAVLAGREVDGAHHVDKCAAHRSGRSFK